MCCSTPLATTGPALPPLPVSHGAPWPSVDTFVQSTDIAPLSDDTLNLIAFYTSTVLPLDAQISDVLRAKLMAGEYVDQSLSLVQPQEDALSINGGVTNSTFCVSPAKPKDVVLSSEQWAF